MRVTDQRLIDLTSAAISKGQADVAASAAQVSSGLRVARPSDDPAAWIAAQRATLRRTLAEGANAAVQAGRDRLDEVDGALATIGDAVSQVRALAIQGASGTYNPGDRAALAVSVRALFTSALGAANTRATDGEYLLAGSRSLAAPFDPAGAYGGDDAERAVPTLESGAAGATVSGARLTAAAGVDVLPLLAHIADALAANDVPALQAGVGDLDKATQQVSLARTRAGGAMHVLDDTVAAHGQLADHLSRTIAQHVEADAIDAATNLAKATRALEASRAVSARVLTVIGGL